MDVFEKLAADLSRSVAELCEEIKRQKALAAAQDDAIESYTRRANSEVSRLRKEIVRLNKEVEDLHRQMVPAYGVMDVMNEAVDICRDAFSKFGDKQ